MVKCFAENLVLFATKTFYGLKLKKRGCCARFAAYVSGPMRIMNKFLFSVPSQSKQVWERYPLLMLPKLSM